MNRLRDPELSHQLLCICCWMPQQFRKCTRKRLLNWYEEDKLNEKRQRTKTAISYLCCLKYFIGDMVYNFGLMNVCFRKLVEIFPKTGVRLFGGEAFWKPTRSEGFQNSRRKDFSLRRGTVVLYPVYLHFIKFPAFSFDIINCAFSKHPFCFFNTSLVVF